MSVNLIPVKDISEKNRNYIVFLHTQQQYASRFHTVCITDEFENLRKIVQITVGEE